MFIVMTAAACMPASCKGTYRRIAVVEVREGAPRPKMISLRARGVICIARTWERLNVGLTERCAYQRALREAKCLAADLNSLDLRSESAI